MYIHVPTPPPAPSKKARELAAKLAELVRILRREDPSISRGEVEQGMRLAQDELRRELGGGSSRALIITLLAGLLALGVAGFFMSANPSTIQAKPMIIIGVIAALGLLGLIAAASKR